MGIVNWVSASCGGTCEHGAGYLGWPEEVRSLLTILGDLKVRSWENRGKG